MSRAQQPAPQSLKIDVDLVLINATVSDSKGRVVTSLRPEDFRVWEDKVEQKIEYFSQGEAPLTAGVIFDASGSMTGNISKAHEAARAFLSSGNQDDEYFLVQFSAEPRLAEQFTTDVFRLQRHLIFQTTRGRTALFDAVYLGLEELKGHGHRRKVLVLITDGEDNHSRYTFSDIKQFAREEDIQIFAIGILDQGAWSRNGRMIIEDLVDLTGGKAYFPTSVDQLEAISLQMAEEIKSEYLIGYRSTNAAKDGKWRRIHLKVTPPKGMSGLSVHAKTGYYAPSMEVQP